MKLLAMTCCCVDVFVNSGELLPGGNALNLCADWAIQGRQMRKGTPHEGQETAIVLLGALGADAYGDAIRDSLAPLDIDTTHLHTIEDVTANHRICIDASGDRYFEPDAWTGGAYETFRISAEDESLIQEMDTVAITFNDPNLQQVMSLRRNMGIHQNTAFQKNASLQQHAAFGHHTAFRLAVDFQDAWNPEEWETWLDAVDVFFISGTPEKESVLRAWSEQHPQKDFIATRGAAGSAVYRNGRTYLQEAIPVASVVDTTGCGDAWLAGYLMSTQAGSGIPDAMKAGAEAAAAVIGHVGGFKVP